MSDEYLKLAEAVGRHDLLRLWNLKRSGFAGIDRQGNIVDRRQCPKAMPIPANWLLEIPHPKPVPYAVQDDRRNPGVPSCR